ncbi:MAG: FecCD family ABC transporter permease [Sporichthyaceae bacterium]
MTLEHPVRFGARRRRLVLLALVGAVVGGVLLSLCLGSVRLGVPAVWGALVDPDGSDPTAELIVRSVRVPRTVTAALAGTALGVSGVVMQTLFRNVLADPYSLGVSSGASLGVAIVVLGSGVGFAEAGGADAFGTVAAASIGAGLVMAFVLFLARFVQSGATLLLIGVIVGSAVTSVVTVMMVSVDPRRVQQFIAWSLGSFGGTDPGELPLYAGMCVVGVAICLAAVKPLNGLLLGERYAQTMGLNIVRLRLVVLATASILAGTVTAFCGPIAFLGITVPHVARLLLGTADHRVLLPAAAMLGAALALLCSVATQLPGDGGVLPINAVTTLIGTPVVLILLLRSRVARQGLTL